MHGMVRNIRWLFLAGVGLLACGGSEAPAARAAASPASGGAVDPASVERVSPQVARTRVQAGQALLVCAYDDAHCARAMLEGAIPFSALQERLPELRQDQEIILYCA